MNLARSSSTTLLGGLLAAAAASQTPLLNVPGTESGSALGWAVAAPGDLDGDGVPDVAIGLPYAAGPAGVAGAVQAYSGADGSLLWTTFGTGDGDQFGDVVERAGDTDGDLVGDMLVGAQWNDDAGGSAGAVYVLSGATGAITRTLLGKSSGERFGTSATGLGDLDNDGRADYAIGTPNADSINGSSTGAVRTYSGGTGAFLGEIPGFTPNSGFGEAVARVADVNGDGLSEVLVGAPTEDSNGVRSGTAYLHDYAGGPPLMAWTGAIAGAEHGTSVTGLGDLNGDGSEDYAVGAQGDASTGLAAGRVWIYSGANGNALLQPLTGLQSGDQFGWDVCGPGDLTGDGVPDIVVGAISSNGNGTNSGSVAIHSGSDGVWVTSYHGAHAHARLGVSIDAIGDFNGDSTADFLVGAFGEDGAGPFSSTGAAWVFSGVNCPPTIYCTAKTNSLGCVPKIATTGVPTLNGGVDELHVTARDVRNESAGLLFLGLAPGTIPFLGGTLCITPPLNRTALQWSAGTAGAPDCSGTFDLHFTQALMAAKGLSAGMIVFGQYYSRDVGFAPPADVGLTDAVSIPICP